MAGTHAALAEPVRRTSSLVRTLALPQWVRGPGGLVPGADGHSEHIREFGTGRRRLATDGAALTTRCHRHGLRGKGADMTEALIARLNKARRGDVHQVA